MTKTNIAKFCALTAGILSLPVASYAGKDMKAPKEIIEKCKESCITGDLGVNIVSQYFSRGVLYENQGSILQPYADLYFKLYEGEGFLNKVSLNLGWWSSFHSNHDTGFGKSTGTTRSWYETDYTFGLTFTMAKNWNVTPSYIIFASPNDAFATAQAINVKVAYDDTDLLGAFALHPYVQALAELENKVGTGPDEGFYFEFGVAPSVPLGPVTLTFPLTLGIGTSDFYVNEKGGNESYGFFSAGAIATYPLAFVPECYGSWSLNAGYTWLTLGQGSDYIYSKTQGGTIRSNSDNEHIFQGGIIVAF
ncbi:MAG: hypothetical protein ABMA13_01435 [Chthoniobacteraceae bacterium]